MFQELAIQQRGPDTGSAITGGAPAAADPNAPAAAPPAAAPAAPVAAPAASAPGVAAPAASGVVAGVGTLAPDGSCPCSVVCNFVSGFPVASQGQGAFGGFAGTLLSSAQHYLLSHH